MIKRTRKRLQKMKEYVHKRQTEYEEEPEKEQKKTVLFPVFSSRYSAICDLKEHRKKRKKVKDCSSVGIIESFFQQTISRKRCTLRIQVHEAGI